MIENKEIDYKKELKNGIMEAFKAKFNQKNKLKLDFRDLKKISSTTGFFKKRNYLGILVRVKLRLNRRAT